MRRCLSGFEAHSSDGGVGTLSEIFDAEPSLYAARLRCAGVDRGRSAQGLVADRAYRFIRSSTSPNA